MMLIHLMGSSNAVFSLNFRLRSSLHIHYLQPVIFKKKKKTVGKILHKKYFTLCTLVNERMEILERGKMLFLIEDDNYDV